MSSRTKLIALAVVAVLVPMTVMSVIQYRSLLELQHQTKMAAQENLRQAATAVTTRTANYFYETGGRTLTAVRFDKNLPEAPLADINQRFSDILANKPEVDRAFAVADCSCGFSEGTAVIQNRKQSRTVNGTSLGRDPEVKELVRLHQRAMAQATQQPKSDPPLLFTYVEGCEKFDFQSYVFYPLLDSRGHEIGFTGLQFDGNQLRKDILPKLLAESLDSNLALALRDDNSRIVYTNKQRPDYQLKMSFAPVFPQWTVGLDFRNASIEELAQSNFRQSVMLSLFVLSMLVVGIALTLRATAREMRLAEAKSSFVSNVSHELKTPLALIRLFAETLELGRVKSEEKAHEYYRIINNESSRLTQLINNILDFSKIEAGRKEYELESADAGQIVENVVRAYEYPIRDQGFDLRVRIQPNLPAVRVDRDAISQAVLNILNNAVKYSDSVKEINVSVGMENDHIAIEIEDRGIGIPASEQQRIFDKFYRISNGLVHDRKGTGLGLTLVKHIVEAHHGAVRVSSAPGKGSRFVIELPVIRGFRKETPQLAYEGSDCRG